MSLTRRFSVLFLGVLSLVLIGFSTAIYVSARIYLDRQMRDRLESALTVLAAAAEIHPDGVEWEPQERVLPLGQEMGPGRLRWLVFDDQGRRIDHSRNWTEEELSAEEAHQPSEALATGRFVDHQKSAWLVSHRQVLPGVPPGLGSTAAKHQVAPPEASPGEVLHRHLMLIVCAPISPSEATLANLALLLAAASFGAWLLAALLCRRLSRSALAPLTRMVASARGLDALDLGWQLDEPGTRDELDELGRAFNDLLARLQLAYHRQRAFSNAASHQLRTPITVLTGQLEVALRQDRTPDEYRRALKAALARGVQLRQIVEALLFLGRAEADVALPDVELLELNRWIAERLDSAVPTTCANEIVHHPDSDNALWVQVHSGLLSQLIDNLLDNAAKYSEPDSVIRVRSWREDEHAVLAVEDTGSGIAEQDLPRVFEAFFRSKTVRSERIPGLGLGLSVVERIAQVFGGRVTVRSELNAGSRFEIRLPLANPAMSPKPSSDATILQHRIREATR